MRIRSIYLTQRLFLLLVINVLLFIAGHYTDIALSAAKVMLLGIGVLLLIDLILLYNVRNGIMATREVPEKLSNGDENRIRLVVKSNYRMPLQIRIIDEVPIQFQVRNFMKVTRINPGQEKIFDYMLRPVKRGEYLFGKINAFAASDIRLIRRCYKLGDEKMTPVYPSYLQMRKYELVAISNRLTDAGIKKIRRIGQQSEFDKIRDYVVGDDLRNINWKATARRAQLMVNQYQDEKSQQVFSIIDMGRSMKMPFEGMALLDYAINASLVISNIALLKSDKAGLITFTDKINTMLPASGKRSYMLNILEVLYNQKTAFLEPNFELLYATVRRKIKQRSLLLLFTNFEGLPTAKRQMHYLRGLARQHLLVVILFENTEIKQLIAGRSTSVEQVYIKTIAEKLAYEKKQIVMELRKYGIHAVLTEPQNLTVATINKYLELKAMGLI